MKDLSKLYRELELPKAGFANGVSIQLYEKQKKYNDPTISLNDKEKQKIIKNAAKYYAKFLEALGVDWKNDPNSDNTPYRVAKSYVEDLWAGRYNAAPKITAFPSEGYNGIVLEKNIPLTSMCSHHHQAILGKVHIAYIPNEKGTVIGLSKLNRIVEYFGRRGAIQEGLTQSIHHAIDKLIENNEGIMVVIEATHQCVSCRGVKHSGAGMVTSQVSGAFADHDRTAKQEVMDMLKISKN